MAAKKNLAFDRAFFHPGERVAVAVSGGADSVALLLALHHANHEQRNGRAVGLGIGLSAVHVHHGIRGAEADADAEFVRALCMKLDLPLHLHRADVPAHAKRHGETMEEAARNVRYAVFREICVSGVAETIATAHTLSDQAETVLMKLLRGAWTEGISGIHPVLELAPKGRVVRPLLGVTREEIEVFLNAQNQPWREDASNADAAYTRNRIRHELLPALRAENPKLDTTLANLAEVARAEQSHWQGELVRLLPQVLIPGRPARGGGRATGAELRGSAYVAIELERLRGMSLALRRRVFRAAAESLGASLNFAAVERILALCAIDNKGVTGMERPATGKGALHLEGGLRAERSLRELRLFLTEAGESEA
ncbi:MAG TPA: tRNA lysidine(34) synthetase TilS [Acidobacteriaceae bacterium]|jgi:tRNA(Ile)-lysidine synthase|nr:tRNA lysidine(34) synthetase TilS [Acidobacteriaceae bacterium]